MPLISYGQYSYFTIEGESLWRNQGYGVSNHSFQIANYIIPLNTTYPVLYGDPITGSCPYEYYTTDYMPLYTYSYSSLSNTLEIRPYSDNDRADYMNGVSTLDLYAIASHLGMGVHFEDRSPTEDAPYRYISADANYSGTVSSADIDMIQDLILGYRDDLTRNSWEWVHKDEVENAEERFIEDPYAFVIDYNWPGSDGIILAEISTNQIIADNDKYFGFRTTKIGDIIGGGPNAVTTNDWICGTGYYFTGDDIHSRSSSTSGEINKVRKGSIITFAVYLDAKADILTIEIPIYYPKDDFSLTNINFNDGFNPHWNYNRVMNSLVVLDYSKNGSPLKVPNGRIFEFKLLANRDIKDIQSLVGLYSERMVEITGMDEKLQDVDLRVEIKDILPPDLYLEIRSEGVAQQAYIESPKDQQVLMHLINEQGMVVSTKQLIITHGENRISIDENLIPGIYLIQIANEKESVVTKLVIY